MNWWDYSSRPVHKITLSGCTCAFFRVHMTFFAGLQLHMWYAYLNNEECRTKDHLVCRWLYDVQLFYIHTHNNSRVVMDTY